MMKRVKLNDDYYELIGLNSNERVGLYKNGSYYLVATIDKKMLIKFTTTNIKAVDNTLAKLGYKPAGDNH